MRKLYLSPPNHSGLLQARQEGHEAYGCDCGPGEWNYHDFMNVHFPTDWFDEISCWMPPDEVRLTEVLRCMRQHGAALIDFDLAGYLESEHFLVQVSLERILTNLGFGVVHSELANGHIVFHLVKMRQNRKKILFPPGMGDCYWIIVKIQSFIRQNSIGIPDVYVVSDTDPVHHRHNRVFQFIEMFPFLNSTGVTITNGVDLARRETCRQAYDDNGQTIFQDVMGCDYFFGFNGPLHAGMTLEQIHPQLECNWELPMFVSLEQQNFMNECLSKYGKYVVFYFSSVGTFDYWMSEFYPLRIVRAVNRIVNRGDVTPVFVGGNWDRDGDVVLDQVISQVPGAVDLRGLTSVQELFGLLRGSSLVVSFPSGLAIMAAHLKAKVLTIWNKYYRQEHWWNICPPSTHNKTYFVIDTDGLKVSSLVRRSLEILGMPNVV